MRFSSVLSQEHASSLEATDEYWAKEARQLLHWHRDFDRTSHVSTDMHFAQLTALDNVLQLVAAAKAAWQYVCQ
jgi:Acetyl-coenzyme A synthetase N-terminus